MTSTNIQMLFTAIVSVSTLVYAILTLMMVIETKKLREVQTEPEIIIYFQPMEENPFFYEIIVKNIGSGVAYNLEWVVDENSSMISQNQIKFFDQNFFKKGVNYFAPGQLFKSFLGGGVELKKISSPFVIQVKFENMLKKKYTRKYNIDPDAYFGRSWIDSDHIKEISNNIKNIERKIDHFASGFDRLHVDIYNSKDREKEQKEFTKLIKDQEEDKNS